MEKGSVIPNLLHRPESSISDRIKGLIASLSATNKQLTQELAQKNAELAQLRAGQIKICSMCVRRKTHDDNDTDEQLSLKYSASEHSLSALDTQAFEENKMISQTSFSEFLTNFQKFYQEKNNQAATAMFGAIAHIVEENRKEVNEQIQLLKDDIETTHLFNELAQCIKEEGLLDFPHPFQDEKK